MIMLFSRIKLSVNNMFWSSMHPCQCGVAAWRDASRPPLQCGDGRAEYSGKREDLVPGSADGHADTSWMCFTL